MLVLGIETSCDETGIGLYDTCRGLLGEALYSQTELHAEYGGVVPELASRDHIRKTLPLIRQVLAESGLTLQDLDGIAYTAGPGLMGALLVGAAIGRSLALALERPAIAVHHMEGHLLAPMLEPDPPDFPFVALLVSGGHTQLVAVTGVGCYRLLGESLDDAAGEAFDKSAVLLGLEYPGGASVSKLAESGQPGRFRFPRPMLDRPGLDFSFSGLKTAVMQVITAQRSAGTLDQSQRADIARGFEEALVETLKVKCERALIETGYERLVIAGGVSANLPLRSQLTAMAETRGARLYAPRLRFCTDNGAMIALVGALRLAAGESTPATIETHPRWPLEQLCATAPPGGAH